MYGYKLKSVDDPIIFAANRSLLLGGSLLTPDASIINIFPFLACIPPWLSGPMTSRKAAAEADELLRFAQGSLMDCAKASVVCSSCGLFMNYGLTKTVTEKRDRCPLSHYKFPGKTQCIQTSRRGGKGDAGCRVHHLLRYAFYLISSTSAKLNLPDPTGATDTVRIDLDTRIAHRAEVVR